MASLTGLGLKRAVRLGGLIGMCGLMLLGQLMITPPVIAQDEEIPPLTQTLSLEDELGTASLSFPEAWAAETDEDFFIFATRPRLLRQGFPYDFDEGDIRGGAFAFETYDTRARARTLLRDTYDVFIQAFEETFEDIVFGRLENLQLEGRDLVTNIGTSPDYDHVYMAIDLEEGNVGVLSVFTPRGEGEALLPTLTAIALTFRYPDTGERPNDDDDTDTVQPPQDDDITDGIVAEPGTNSGSTTTTTAPDISTYTEILVSENGKLTVYYPSGWATNSEDEYVELANSRRTLNRDFPYDLRDSDEFVIGVIPTESARRDEDRVLLSLLEDYQQASTNDDLEVRWGDTQERDLNGRKALLVIGTADEADQIVIVVSLGEERYVTVVLFTAPDNTESFISIAEALASIVQFDPEGVPDFQNDGRDA